MNELQLRESALHPALQRENVKVTSRHNTARITKNPGADAYVCARARKMYSSLIVCARQRQSETRRVSRDFSRGRSPRRHRHRRRRGHRQRRQIDVPLYAVLSTSRLSCYSGKRWRLEGLSRNY